MHPFTFAKPRTEDDVLAAGASGGRYIAGGTTLGAEVLTGGFTISSVRRLTQHRVSATLPSWPSTR